MLPVVASSSNPLSLLCPLPRAPPLKLPWPNSMPAPQSPGCDPAPIIPVQCRAAPGLALPPACDIAGWKKNKKEEEEEVGRFPSCPGNGHRGGSHATAAIFNLCVPPASLAFPRNLLLGGSKWGKGSSPQPPSQSSAQLLRHTIPSLSPPREQSVATLNPHQASPQGPLCLCPISFARQRSKWQVPGVCFGVLSTPRKCQPQPTPGDRDTGGRGPAER